MRISDLGKNLTSYFEDGLFDLKIDSSDYKVSSKFDIKKPSVLMGLTFGLGVEEGSYNPRIARFLCHARAFFGNNAPIYAQAEVGYCLSGIEDVFSFGDNYGGNKEISLFLPKYTTYNCMKQMAQDITSKNIDNSNIAFVAHPAHMHRVIGIGKKLGLEGGVFMPKEIEWAPHDPQVFVRGVKTWVPREIAARVHHLIKKQL